MPQEHYLRTHGFSTIPVIHPALFFDDCSGTMNWLSSGTGAEYSVEYDPAAAFVQTNGLIIKTRATTPAIGDVVNAYRKLWLPPLGILRLQAMFSLLTDAPDQNLDFIIFWYDGTTVHTAALRFTASTGAVYRATGYAAPDITWTIIPELSIPVGDDHWNKLDLSFNPLTDRYHKIEVNENVLDGSNIAIHTRDVAMTPFVYLLLRTTAVAAAQVTAYIDQILLTQEAP